VVDIPLWKMMEFVSWDDDIPNIWKKKKCLKPPTRKNLKNPENARNSSHHLMVKLYPSLECEPHLKKKLCSLQHICTV